MPVPGMTVGCPIHVTLRSDCEMNPEVSRRIELLRFPLIVGVVFIHSFSVYMVMAGIPHGVKEPGWVSFLVRNLLSEGICRIPVPMLFATSGYLFFWGMDFRTQGLQAIFLKKWKSRLRTLVLPFLLWNAFVLVLILCVQHTRWAFLFDVPPIVGFRPSQFANAMIGFSGMPIAYQLWFLRNLILYAAMAPLLYWTLKLAGRAFLLTMAVLLLTYWWPFRIPDAPGLLYFCLGAWLALTRFDLLRMDRWLKWLLPVYLVVLVVDMYFKPTHWSGHIHNFGLLFGLPVAFILTGRLTQTRVGAWLYALAPASFFLYAAHDPLLMLTRKILYWTLQPTSDGLTLALYFGVPTLVISICTALYFALRRACPGFISQVTGSR